MAASSACYGKPLTTHTLPWALSSIHNKKSAGTGQGSAASVSTIDVTCKNRKIVAPMFESILVGSPGATRSVLVLTKKEGRTAAYNTCKSIPLSAYAISPLCTDGTSSSAKAR
ncbi:hypothetical protein [Paenibacillus sp. FSL R5-0765]|uniref:hypothetical protein n=1 Tax=Paenibacillus sp. FSL R5-0765 TaxID=1920425 RepID=UPI00117FC34F|nr:hypothetical protein [Paenibacillus sp. FSL R5-0765]